jgi:hypothetical protein
MDSEQYLKERVMDQIKWYSKKADHNKRMNYWAKSLVIVFAAFIPVLTQVDFDPEWKNLSLAVLGALIAITSGISGLLKFDEKWTKYRAAGETLKHELFLVKTLTGPYEGVERPLGVLVNRVETLLGEENSMWREYIAGSSNR